MSDESEVILWGGYSKGPGVMTPHRGTGLPKLANSFMTHRSLGIVDNCSCEFLCWISEQQNLLSTLTETSHLAVCLFWHMFRSFDWPMSPCPILSCVSLHLIGTNELTLVSICIDTGVDSFWPIRRPINTGLAGIYELRRHNQHGTGPSDWSEEPDYMVMYTFNVLTRNYGKFIVLKSYFYFLITTSTQHASDSHINEEDTVVLQERIHLFHKRKLCRIFLQMQHVMRL